MEERGGGTRQRHLVPSQSSKGINGSRLGNRASMQQRARGRAGGDFVSSSSFFGEEIVCYTAAPS
jgi:hypothetical protein